MSLIPALHRVCFDHSGKLFFLFSCCSFCASIKFSWFNSQGACKLTHRQLISWTGVTNHVYSVCKSLNQTSVAPPSPRSTAKLLEDCQNYALMYCVCPKFRTAGEQRDHDHIHCPQTGQKQGAWLLYLGSSHIPLSFTLNTLGILLYVNV